ncbi:hypothetical protein GOODEAATRI_022623, partial [Goodea atripinnis]
FLSHDGSLTLLFCPDQCTMAWLWDESPVRANVELFSFNSSCRAPAALRSSPLQRGALRPAAVPCPSTGARFRAELTLSPSLSRLKRRGLKPTPSLCWETLPFSACPLWLSIIRFSLCSAYFSTSGEHSAEPGSQGILPVRSPLPQTCPLNVAAGPLVSTLSSNSCARHLCPSWHDLQVISASATRSKQGRMKKSPNRSAPCHFGQNPTSLFMAGGRKGCSGCLKSSLCLTWM